MKKRMVICAVVAACACAMSWAGGLGGLSGVALLRAVRQEYAPESLPLLNESDAGVLMEKALAALSAADGMAPDMMGRTDAAVAPAVTYAVMPQWFTDAATARKAAADVHNMISLAGLARVSRGDVALMDVDAPAEESSDGWRRGTRTYPYGGRMECMEPYATRKGEIARRVMYAVAVYGSTMWTGHGSDILADFSDYPAFYGFAAEQYMAWHRACPPTEAERRRNDAAERLQGNRNPFVDIPELAEYLWGDKRGESMPGDVTPPDRPDDGAEALKAVYALSETVWLRSPYAPEGAVWRIDGTETRVESVKASDLGSGSHELRFATETAAGKIIIRIKP